MRKDYFQSCALPEEVKQSAIQEIHKRINKKLKRAKHLDIEEIINPLKDSNNKGHIPDSFGKRLLGMKLSEAIAMLEGFKKEHGDLKIKKMSHVNMGLCLVKTHQETDKETLARIEEQVRQIVTNEVWAKIQKQQEIEQLQKRINTLKE